MGIRGGAGIPDVSIDRIRNDFGLIFDTHKTTAVRIRDSEPTSGEFFNEGTSNTTTRTNIEVSVQGTPDAIKRLAQGVSVPQGLVKGYVEYTTDINENDLFEIFGQKFKIGNLAESIKSGNSGFKEFDLVSTNRVP